MLFFILLLSVSSFAFQEDPVSLSCALTKISSGKWDRDYNVISRFQGFFLTVGGIYQNVAYPYGYDLQPLFETNTSLWHQYIHPVSELMIGEFYLDIPIPGYGLILESNQTINAIKGTPFVCYIYLDPTPANIKSYYTETLPRGIGTSQTVFMSTDPSTLEETMVEEYFRWDSNFTSSFNSQDTFGTSFPQNIISQSRFTYTQISYEEAVALGYTGSNPAPFSGSPHGRHLGGGKVISDGALSLLMSKRK